MSQSQGLGLKTVAADCSFSEEVKVEGRLQK